MLYFMYKKFEDVLQLHCSLFKQLTRSIKLFGQMTSGVYLFELLTQVAQFLRLQLADGLQRWRLLLQLVVFQHGRLLFYKEKPTKEKESFI